MTPEVNEFATVIPLDAAGPRGGNRAAQLRSATASNGPADDAVGAAPTPSVRRAAGHE